MKKVWRIPTHQRMREKISHSKERETKPITQTKLHIPGKQTGNCMVAAIASILEIDISIIPEFENMEPYRWYLALEEWLETIGFYLLRWDYEITLPGYYIANGPSPRGVEHSVVYRNGKCVHDPHPSRSGLDKVTSVWAFLSLDPAMVTEESK